MSPWVSVAAVVVLGGLGLALVGWLVRSELQERRKARYLAQLSAQYRTARPALLASAAQEPDPAPRPAESARQVVTVAELVARMEAEGLPVRLKWEDAPGDSTHGQLTADADEWPTGVLPRVEDNE